MESFQGIIDAARVAGFAAVEPLKLEGENAKEFFDLAGVPD